ncbi:MAG: hypothetical protein FJZ58_01700 [Chlamydiae bacterium]|nr:hypothetical protein [Chlamydiota bacterium]
MSNFQFALLDATIRSQTTLGNKQTSDAQSSILANDLLETEYNDATAVLTKDTENVQSITGTSTEDTDALTQANQEYQNDSSVAQTGESNANTAVQAEQTQVSQDGTNLSNLVSLSSTLIQIGQYIAGLIGTAYTS